MHKHAVMYMKLYLISCWQRPLNASDSLIASSLSLHKAKNSI